MTHVTFAARTAIRRSTIVLALLGALAGAPAAHAAGEVPPSAAPSAAWLTNGAVSAYAVSGTTAYVGGAFTYVGPRTGVSTVLDPQSGARDADFAQVTGGSVLAAASDGDGGWFIGGTFTAVSGVVRANIAHIRADGSLDTQWNPMVNGAVNALERQGTTLYVGGAFTTVAGITRNRIAALRTTGGGGPTDWDPNASAAVSTMMLDGAKLYVGGAFTTIGGATRNRLAALDTALDSNMVTNWNPNVNGAVSVIRLQGTALYIGGAFTTIGGLTRNRIGAVDTTLDTGNVLAFNPNAQAAVADLVVAGSSVYVAGAFTTIGGQTRASLAKLNAATGLATSWNPSPSTAPAALETDGTTVYVGGTFASISGQARAGLAAYSVADDAITTWNPTAIGAVLELQRSAEGDLLTGGSFSSVNAVPRSRLAAIDLTTGEATSWDPRPNGVVSALDVRAGVVYAGGAFTAVGLETRNRIAAIDASSGAVLSWNPNAGAAVSAVLATADGVYAAGTFTTIGLQTRNRIARLSAATGLADDWDPNANGIVNALMVTGDGVYLGGAFTQVGATTRNRVARISPTTGIVDSWNPDANGIVSALDRDAHGVYIGGAFTTVGVSARSRLARVNTTSGAADAWNPTPNNTIAAISVAGDSVFVGGAFTAVAGVTRNRVAALDAEQNTANAVDWDPNAGAAVTAIKAIDPGTVLVGGAFLSFGTAALAQQNSALFIAPPAATAAPQLEGTAQVGETLTCGPGSWNGLPTAFGYAWFLGTDELDDESSDSYVVRAGDVGRSIRCEVAARNLTATRTEPSSPASVLPAAPVNLEPPRVDGVPRAGSVVVCVGALWSGVTQAPAYRWFVGGSEVQGETGQVLRLQSSVAGADVRCSVTGTNAGGSRTAHSPSVGIAAAGPRLLAAPVLRAKITAGAALTCPAATWAEQPLTRSVVWHLDDTPIPGADGSSIRTTPRMVGRAVTCTTTAFGADGTNTVRSSIARVIPAVEVTLAVTGLRASVGRLPSVHRGDSVALAGSVRNDAGKPVSQALVTLTSGRKIVGVGVTDARGNYRIPVSATKTLRLRATVSGPRAKQVSLPHSAFATIRVS